MNRKRLVFILIILFIGLFLRLYNLSYQDVWIDEFLTKSISERPLMGVISYPDTSPPLYFIIAHYWGEVFGYSIFTLRVISVLFGTSLIFAVYLLGKRLYEPKTGLIAAILISISPIFIYYSQEARTYSLFFLLAVLSFYFYLKFYDSDTKSIKTMWPYLLVNLLLVYSHFFGLFIIFTQFIHFLTISYMNYRMGKNMKNQKIIFRKFLRFFGSNFLVLLLLLPWIFKLSEIIGLHEFNWIPKPSYIHIFYFLTQLSFGLTLPLFGYLIMVIFLTLFFMKVLSRAKDKNHEKENENSKLLLLWLVVPIVIAYVISYYFSSIFTPKYLLVSGIPLLILVANQLSLMRKKYFNHNLGLIVLSLILILTLPIIVIQQNTVLKSPWKDASNYIDNRRIIQDPVEPIAFIAFYEALTYGNFIQHDCMGKIDHNLILDCLGTSSISGLNTIDDYNSFVRNQEGIVDRGSFWLVISNAQHRPKNKKIIDKIESEFVMTENKIFYLHKSRLFLGGDSFFFNKKSTENDDELGIEVRHYKKR